MSQLTNFYAGHGTDSEGRTLQEIWAWRNDKWEFSHDYIQWLFPLDEPSNFNPDAPLVGREERLAFVTNAPLKTHLRISLYRFLNFLGLDFVWQDGGQEKPPKVVPGKDFQDLINIGRYPNHNWMRITRVLRSLRLLGCDEEAQAFWECLQKLHAEEGYGSDNTFSFWEKAATEPLQICISL